MKQYAFFEDVYDVEEWLEEVEYSARMNGLRVNEAQLAEAESIAVDYQEAELINTIGAFYFEGNGVKQDQERAVELYKLATELGYYQAASNLGYCYYYGNGTEKDMKKAVQAFDKGEVLGSTECSIKLGDMYMNGEFVDQDESWGAYLYLRVYDYLKNNINIEDRGFQQSYSSLCLRLAKCYYECKGVKRDLREAEYLLATAKYYYELREEWNDYYCKSGLKEACELQKTLIEEKAKVREGLN